MDSYFNFGISSDLMGSKKFERLERKNLNFIEYLEELQKVFLFSKYLRIFRKLIILVVPPLLYLLLMNKMNFTISPATREPGYFYLSLIEETANVSEMDSIRIAYLVSQRLEIMR